MSQFPAHSPTQIIFYYNDRHLAYLALYYILPYPLLYLATCSKVPYVPQVPQLAPIDEFFSSPLPPALLLLNTSTSKPTPSTLSRRERARHTVHEKLTVPQQAILSRTVSETYSRTSNVLRRVLLFSYASFALRPVAAGLAIHSLVLNLRQNFFSTPLPLLIFWGGSFATCGLELDLSIPTPRTRRCGASTPATFYFSPHPTLYNLDLHPPWASKRRHGPRATRRERPATARFSQL